MIVGLTIDAGVRMWLATPQTDDRHLPRISEISGETAAGEAVEEESQHETITEWLSD
jgi:hypothetical protein